MKNDYDTNLSLATVGFNHTIKLWQPNTGICIQGFQHNESQVNALAFSRDGHYLAAAGYGRVRVYDVQGPGTPFVTVSDFTKSVNTVGSNDTGNWMFAGAEDPGGNICISHISQASSSINTMLLHRNQHEIIIGTNKGEVIIWDLRNNAAKSISNNTWNEPIHSLSIDQDVISLAAVNSDGHPVVWSLTGDSAWNPLEKHRQKVHPSFAVKVQFSPDGTLIATGGGDGKFNILKTADFSVVTSKKGSVSGHHWTWDCAFSADSRFLITATSDGIARLWNLDTNEVPIEYKGHQRAITCMAFRDNSLRDLIFVFF
ncbi:unnamed protein product [Trichobilharzia regenti]|nr:unnamed protein product [Trichobilharzia regenti]